MQTSEKSTLIEALLKGTVTVAFQKIDSDEIRGNALHFESCCIRSELSTK